MDDDSNTDMVKEALSNPVAKILINKLVSIYLLSNNYTGFVIEIGSWAYIIKDGVKTGIPGVKKYFYVPLIMEEEYLRLADTITTFHKMKELQLGGHL